MPFEIVRNDIVNMDVDAVVNSANPRPAVGPGTDAAIHMAAGPELLAAREKIGQLRPGEARITKGYQLKARYVIHTVGPVWVDGRHQETEILRRCYENALALAAEHRLTSIAFPLISAGNYGFPRGMAIGLAVDAIRTFLSSHEMKVILVVFDRQSYELSASLTRQIRAFVDEHYVDEKQKKESRGSTAVTFSRRSLDASFLLQANVCSVQQPGDGASISDNLNELLAQKDAGFAETLVALIEQSGRKNSEVYKKANVDKKLFSKIINNVNYHPSKTTAVAFAVALELDLEQTKDLVGRAGYSITHSSKFDIIVEYFLLHHNYDIFEINEALFAFDQSLLGS